MSKDATIGAPAADATGSGGEPDVDEEPDDAVVTVYTHDGEEWVPSRLEPGETTSVRLPNGRPLAVVEVDEEGEITDALEGADLEYGTTD